MLKCVSKAVVLAFLVALPAAGQEFEKGLDAYNNGDYGTALSGLQPMALKGERRAQHYLAFMYLRGKGVPQSDSKAVTWFRRAAEQGHMKAQYNLGVMYHIGLGVKQNDAQAVRWFRAAADQGHSEAHQNLIFMRSKGRRLKADTASAQAEISGRIKAAKKRRDFRRPLASAQPPLPRPKPQNVKSKTIDVIAAPPQTVVLNKPAEKTIMAVRPTEKSKNKSEVKTTPMAAPALVTSATQSDNAPPPKPSAIKSKSMRNKKQTALAIPSKTTQAAPPEDFHVQLGAIKLKARAIQEAGRLNRMHKTVLGDLKIVPVRSDLGKRGIFYRLRAGPLNGWSSANSLCRELSVRKQRCIVAKP